MSYYYNHNLKKGEKMKKILILASIFLASSVFAKNAPVKIETQTNRLMGAFGFQNITITALDDITINSITLNRGNCKVAHPNFKYKFPQKAKYSTTKTFMTNCRDILEITIDVDGLEWTFSQN